MLFNCKYYFVKAVVLFFLITGFVSAENPSHKKSKPIPYPNRSMYLDKGITGSLGFGIYRVEGIYTLDGVPYTPSAVFQWQGEGSFYYKPFISGGVSSKIIAGEPTDNSTMVDNRYMVFTRVHHRMKDFAIFIGPTVGLHNLTLEADSTRESQKDIDISIPALRYGLEIGSGLRLNNALGITMGTELEHSITEEYLIRYSVGGALSLLYLWPHLTEMVKGFYLMFEYKFAQVSDYSNFEREKESMFMLGGAVAF